MSRSIELRDGATSRSLGLEDFPLLIGGQQADVAVPGIGPDPIAYLGLADGELFVQPGATDGEVSCNGAPLTTSQWLRGGDVVRIGSARIRVEAAAEGLRLRVEHPASDNETEPPMVLASDPAPHAAASGPPAPGIAPVRFEPKGVVAAARRRRRRLRAAPLLLWAAGLLLAGLVWLTFTAQPVELLVEPKPDHLRVEGGLLHPRLGGRFLLRPGAYRLVAEKRGYRRLAVPIEVTRERNQSYAFDLELLPGRLVVEAMAGASLSVGEQPRGVLPLAPVELEAGQHELRLEAERYLPFETFVTIEGGGVTQTLEAELTPAWAEVSVASVPAGAAVDVDGERWGPTPLTAELLEGAHDLVLRLPGHKPRRLTVEVTAGRPLSVGPIRLGANDGRLALASEPSGAAVTVGGLYQGETPLELQLEPGQQHRLHLSKRGYESRVEEVEIGSGAAETLSLTLEAREGEVAVVVSPPDAEVLVDGEPSGKGRQTLRLPSVPHSIEVRKPGYAPFRTTVTPRPGYQQEVRADLQTVAEAREAGIARVIRSPQGAELRLIDVGKRFQLGASRREPGRRANESLREVVLTRRFYIATREVSNRELRQFQPDHQSGLAGLLSLEGDDLPAVRVTWERAAAFCNWLSQQAGLPPAYVEEEGRLRSAQPLTIGYRLPTEAEWAWVARYPDGKVRKYPWGDSLPVAPESGNYADRAARDMVAGALPGYEDGFPATAPVDSFEPNPLGLQNLGGNVAEWVHDLYTIYSSSSSELERDPLGPAEGDHHVIRGSSWMDASITELRLSYRDYGDKARPDVGFRIARYLE